MRASLLLLLVLPLTVLAQDVERAPVSTASIAYVVDEMPELRDGLAELLGRVVYPKEAEERRLEGRVLIGFVVTEDGQVIDAEVLESVDPILDRVALEAIEATRFRPGVRNGITVRVRMAMPITFALPHSED